MLLTVIVIILLVACPLQIRYTSTATMIDNKPAIASPFNEQSGRKIKIMMPHVVMLIYNPYSGGLRSFC